MILSIPLPYPFGPASIPPQVPAVPMEALPATVGWRKNCIRKATRLA